MVHGHIRVKPDRAVDFQAAYVADAETSAKEPGIARFDVLRQQDDPTRFVLVEIYRTAEAPAAHERTDHYKKGAETVAGTMAVPLQDRSPTARASDRFEYVR